MIRRPLFSHVHVTRVKGNLPGSWHSLKPVYFHGEFSCFVHGFNLRFSPGSRRGTFEIPAGSHMLIFCVAFARVQVGTGVFLSLWVFSQVSEWCGDLSGRSQCAKLSSLALATHPSQIQDTAQKLRFRKRCNNPKLCHLCAHSPAFHPWVLQRPSLGSPGFPRQLHEVGLSHEVSQNNNANKHNWGIKTNQQKANNPSRTDGFWLPSGQSTFANGWF